MNNKILVLGTIAYDAIETPFDKSGKILGGCATYIGLSTTHFDNRCGLVSIVGNDFEKQYLDMLIQKEIDLSGVELHPTEKTFFWSGRYHNDLNTRTTLDTQLNVIEKFNPVVPENFKDASFLMLGNLHPALQLEILEQMPTKPEVVLLDTMNYWIADFREDLDEIISKTNVISINDEEARMLTNCHSLVKAAQKIQKMGPEFVIIKKGEHGALLFYKNEVFCAPALPLEEVFDPTGAGDSFIGGIVGFLAQQQQFDYHTMKTALIYGSVLASITVEQFGVKSLQALETPDLIRRIRTFKNLTEYEIELP